MNVKRVILGLALTLAFIVLFTTCTRRVDQNFAARRSPVAEQIFTRIKASNLRAGGEPIYASVALNGFYERRLYRPAWANEQSPTRLVDDLVNALRRADIEGLRPSDYHLAAIEARLAALRADIQKGLVVAPDRFAELDLLLTDAFLLYGSHLLPGRVNPETLQQQWVANERSVALANVLESALGSNNIAGALGTLSPAQPGFRRLREALVHYRELASSGGWPTIPDGPTLKRGDNGSRVAALRERLSLDGYSGVAKWEYPTLFDETLEQALKRFQLHHSLNATGTLDAATRAELNVSVERRMEQLEVNLERWRWLPQDLGRRYILVNIPTFKLEVVEDGSVVLDMRIVVGTANNPTPVLNDKVKHIALNPYWNVPRDMLLKEMLPRIRSDPSYLARGNYRVLKGSGPEAREVDPATVNWWAINPDDFPYRLRQDPGPHNGMGRLKFIFINKFNVYLHDTPGRHLFEKTQRAFSHGCIRIEKPIDLAVYLLRQDPRWNRDALLGELGKKVGQNVMLPEQVPVYLVYWTARANADGTIQFCPDIYGWDAPLLGAMRARAPLPTKKVVGPEPREANNDVPQGDKVAPIGSLSVQRQY